MKLKNIIAVLAILLVTLSASAVCAEDSAIASDDSQNGDAVAEDTVPDTGADNNTAPATDVTNTTNGTDINNTTDTTNTTNTTGNATNAVTNATNSTSLLDDLTKFATGNPILILVVILAALGIYTIKRGQ